MPLTLIVTEGLLPQHRHQDTLARLAGAFLRLHGLENNDFLVPNVVGYVQAIPQGSACGGAGATPIAVVEWLTPSFAFASRGTQQAYVLEATEIVFEACGGRQPREKIWVNVKHAVDGTWGIGGKAYSNAELSAAIASA